MMAPQSSEVKFSSVALANAQTVSEYILETEDWTCPVQAQRNWKLTDNIVKRACRLCPEHGFSGMRVWAVRAMTLTLSGDVVR